MTSGLFVVIRTRGPGWLDGRSLESQPDWAAHASFFFDAGVLLGTTSQALPQSACGRRARRLGASLAPV